MTITAKFPGTCTKCGRHFAAGETINWQRGRGSAHAACSTYPSRSRIAERLNPDSKYWAGRGYGDGDL